MLVEMMIERKKDGWQKRFIYLSVPTNREAVRGNFHHSPLIDHSHRAGCL